MLKAIISAVSALVIISVCPAIAQAKQEVQKTVTIMELSDFPELQTKAKAVCASQAVQSVKLQEACKADKFPAVTKAGAFRNVGIGAELNTLIRQTAGGSEKPASATAEKPADTTAK